MPAAESYPDDLRYHPEHDWARVEGDEATLGITWFAQDSLGELVHYEAPEAGSTVTNSSGADVGVRVAAEANTVTSSSRASRSALRVKSDSIDPERLNER